MSANDQPSADRLEPSPGTEHTWQARLTWGQRQMYRAMQLDPQAEHFHMTDMLLLRGQIDLERLSLSLAQTFAAHPALHIRLVPFTDSAEGVVQRFDGLMPVDCLVHDWSGLPSSEIEVRLAEIRTSFGRAPFDLAAGPLFRVTLVRTRTDEAYLLMTLHHLLADDWSMGLLQQDLAARYTGVSITAEAPAPYFEFARHQEAWLQSREGAKAVAYWTALLQALPVRFPIPADRPRPTMPLLGRATVSGRLAGEVSQSLRKVGRDARGTLFPVMLAAYNVLLWRLSLCSQVPVATLVANREDGTFDRTVGLFFNTIVLVSDVRSEQPFCDFVAQVMATTLDGMQRQAVPFQYLVDRLCPMRDPARVPFTQAMFSFMAGAGRRLRIADAELEQFGGIDTGSAYDLKVTAYEKDDGVEILFEYDADLFNATTVRAWHSTYLNILADAAAQPRAPVQTLGFTQTDHKGSVLVVQDTWGAPVPPGFAGELCRHQSGEVVRTGILARRTAEGRIQPYEVRPAFFEVEGRRVEVSAIEHCAQAVTGVRQALLTFDETRGLAIHLVVEAGVFRLPALRRHLFASLPAFCVPSLFRIIPWVSESIGGIPDLDELWQTGRDAETFSSSQEPRDPHETQVLDIWSQALGISSLGPDDDFLGSGGNSLTAALIVAQTNGHFGCSITLRQLFDARTAARFAVLTYPNQASAKVGPWYEQTQVRSAHSAQIEADGSVSYPVSEAQARMWILDRLIGPSDRYVLKNVYRVDGPLDAEALGTAFAALVRRHEQLRAVFLETAGLVRQCILPVERVALNETFWDSLPGSESSPPASITQAVDELFDLRTGPLARALLVRTRDPAVHFLYLTLHHIVADGWSLGVLFDDWLRLYIGDRTLPALPGQYRDYCCWKASDAVKATVGADLSYWRERLAGASATLSLPERVRGTDVSQRGGRHGFRLSAPLYKELSSLAGAENATVYAVLLAAFATVLSRHTGRSDLSIGVPIANRNEVGTDRIVGLFVNTVVMRLRIDASASLHDLLLAARDTVHEALAHGAAPFEAVVQALQPQRHMDASPLFETMFTFQNLPPVPSVPGELSLRGVRQPAAQAKFKLGCTLTLVEGMAYGELEFREDLLDSALIERFAADYVSVLTQWAQRPDSTCGALRVSIARPRPIAAASAPSLVGMRALWEIVHRQAQRTPDRAALRDRLTVLSYTQLDAQSARIAAALRALGLGHHARVGLCMPRSPQAIVCLLGILRAGAAYCPMEADGDIEVWREQAHGARLDALVMQSDDPVQVNGLRILSFEHLLALDSEEVPSAALHPQATAVVFRTSGSTGRPKYVSVPHEGILALIAWACDTYDPETYRHSTLATSLGFDVSLFEMFVPWALGGCGVLMDHLLVPYGGEPPLSCVSGTPSQIRALLEQRCFPVGAVTLNVAGEALPPDLVQRIFEQTQVHRIVNLYGPTECSIYASCEDIRRNGGPIETVRIGHPPPHVSMYVIDTMGCEAPEGVAGEICIGGRGLAHGYTGQAALTAEHFLPDPFSGVPGARMYRTRDIGRVDSEGAVSYLGRADGVQKLRGIWVNFHELAADIRACPGVGDAVVLPIPAQEGEGETGVVAFCVPEDGAHFDEASLRRLFRQHVGRARPLAYGRIINRFVRLDVLPLTPNGKVDLQSLASLVPGRPVRPSGAVVQTDLLWHALRDAWSRALNVEDLDESDDFFVQGGHSLLALRMLGDIEASTGLALPFASIFEFPVFAEFVEEAARVARMQARPDAAAGPIQRVRRGDGSHLPVSAAQRRLWFIDQFEQGTHHNVPIMLHLHGATDADRLIQAVRACLHCHEVFRTSFHFVDGDIVASIVDATAIEPLLDDWSMLTPQARRDRESAWRQDQATHRFDLSRPGLGRVQLARLGHDEWLLAMVFHHIVTDGASIALLTREIGQRYGCPDSVPAPQLQYVDYAAWDRRNANNPAHQEHLAYWTTQLSDAPAFLSLPADYPRPVVSSHAGAAHAFLLPREELEDAGRLFAQLGVSRFTGLLTLFKLAVHHHTGSRDICIGTPVTNRRALPTHVMQGYFLDMLVIRTRFVATDTLADLIANVSALCSAAFRHQAPGFDAIVERLQPERTSGYHPMFQLAFVYTDGAAPDSETPDLRWVASQGGNRGAQFDLTCHCNETLEGLWVTLDYKTELYAPQTIVRFGDYLRRCLALLRHQVQEPIASFPIAHAPESVGRIAVGPQVLDKRLADGFERQASLNPDAIAVKTTAGDFSYATLEAQANRLAARLLRDGLQPGERVAVCLERNESLLVALLSISKAGGCFVPFDSQTPLLRLQGILTRHAIRRLVTTHALLAPLSGVAQPLALSHLYDFGTFAVAPAWPGVGCIVGRQDWAGESDERVSAQRSSLLPAYVIFTSGSTGMPKGVVIGHAAACSTIDWINARFGIKTGDRLMWCASVGFDLSIYDLFGTLAAGGTVCVADRGMLADPVILASYLTHWEITIWNSAPAALQFALSGCEVLGAAYRCDSLRLVMLSGDRIPVKLPAAGSVPFPNAHWHALGGATEAAIWSNHYEIGDREGALAISRTPAIPYGRAFGAATYYVMNNDFQVCPDGVEGELFIGGGCLAEAYLDAPDLTAERFLPNPFEAGARLYRTGDRAKRDAFGTLWILGRWDNQVKVRGHRIELGEVENTLQGLDQVKCAVVLKDALRDAIYAYVECHAPGVLDCAEIHQHLANRLPYYMIPSAIYPIEAWPMTANGKLDRGQLSRSHEDVEAKRHHAPLPAAGTVAHQLAAIWEAVLQVPVNDPDRSFFDYGGSSLKAIEMLHKVAAHFGTALRVRDIFHHQTLSLFATCIERRGASVYALEGNDAVTLWKPGDAALPALVLIAPPGADGACYAALMDELSSLPGAIYTVSLTLSVLRRWHEGLDHTIDALCLELACAIAGAGITKFVPCGWSFGGTLAAHIQRHDGEGELSPPALSLLIDSFEADVVACAIASGEKSGRSFDGPIGSGLLPVDADDAARAELVSLSFAVLQAGNGNKTIPAQSRIELIESMRGASTRASASWPGQRLLRTDVLDAHHYEMLHQPWAKEVATWIKTCLGRTHEFQFLTMQRD